MKRLAFFLITVFFVGMSVAGVKYVAVVETDVDAASGASANLNPAEVREITAELRRQAIENLPPDRYSVMTSETVQSMGGAVLEECADENCVITLGSKIGADYIVRGTVGKFQTRFTLKIEMYETDNGTLVATSEPVRTENVGEILDRATMAAGDMYRKFAGAKSIYTATTLQKNKAESEVVARKTESGTINGRKLDYYFAPKYQQVIRSSGYLDYWWCGGNLEGGLVWGNGMFVGIDFGVSVDFSDHYAGGGVSFGDVYDFGNQLQLVYGGSVGFWADAEGVFDIIAPFVKLRWNFVELTYRGLLGNEYNHQLMLGLYFATNKRER